MKQIRWALMLMVFALILAACPAPAAQPPASTSASQATPTTAASTEVTQTTDVSTTQTTTSAAQTAPSGDLIPVNLQLQWVAQSQFAGYYAAVDQGYYKSEGLDVKILEGGVDIVPQTMVASDKAEFGIAWVPKMLASREQGADLVNIAQVFQRSGTLEISWKDSNITKPEDWKGKRIGTWGYGNEFELFAAMRKVNIEPNEASQVTIVQQPFDMSLLLNKQIDAAEAMIYNEYAQVLEASNPATGKLYQPTDLNVINFNDVGTAMLQDHIFARESWLKEAGHEDVATKFLRASFKGWIFCRDHLDECVQIVLKNGPTLGEGHMRWQLNEINALIWPSPNGIGIMDDNLYKQTVDISTQSKILEKAPDAGAVRKDLAQKALDGLKDVDTTGEKFEKQQVEVTAGGE